MPEERNVVATQSLEPASEPHGRLLLQADHLCLGKPIVDIPEVCYIQVYFPGISRRRPSQAGVSSCQGVL